LTGGGRVDQHDHEPYEAPSKSPPGSHDYATFGFQARPTTSGTTYGTGDITWVENNASATAFGAFTFHGQVSHYSRPTDEKEDDPDCGRFRGEGVVRTRTLVTYNVEFTVAHACDKGEPGRQDHIKMKIKVLAGSAEFMSQDDDGYYGYYERHGPLTGGNIQKHDLGWESEQSVGGNGFGAFVKTALGVQQSSVAELPSTGGYALGDDLAFTLQSSAAARWLTSVSTGGADATARASSQTSSAVEDVSVLNGLIRADIVTAIATSVRNSTSASSDADGSGFTNLVVNGIAFNGDPPPNTWIELPGVGHVVLNEHVRTGDGVTASAITVNMIHVYLRDSLTGIESGEIIVGSASSRVGF
jgi:hypothetical protein